MKAIVYKNYGCPKVLKMENIEKPKPNDNEILVKVLAVSLNHFEKIQMRGRPYITRTYSGLFKPKNNILGNDFAGIVISVGQHVRTIRKGDQIFGASDFGALAEYIIVDEDRIMFRPSNCTPEEAATLPTAALTALQGLRDHGKISSKQKVLINGASGGVGTFAVQIAKWYGAEVTAVCSFRNLEMVSSLGADYVIDYLSEDIVVNSKKYDLIFDTVGNLSMSNYKKNLYDNGKLVVVGFLSLAQMYKTKIYEFFDYEKCCFMSPVSNQEDFLFLKMLVESGKVSPVIDKCFPLHETGNAMSYLEQGRAKGKVVVSLQNVLELVN